MTTTEQTTATVQAGPLRDLITDLLRTADTDPTLPMLCGIRLHTDAFGDEPVLVGRSTDRFTVGQAHIAATGNLAESFVPISSCKRALAVLKLLDHTASVDLAETGDGALTLTAVDLSSRLPVSGAEFPNMAPIFKAIDEREPAPGGTPVAFNPRFVSRFAAIAKDRDEHLVIVHTTDSTAALVTIGSRYRGAIMPVRQSEGAVKAPWFLAPSELAALEKAKAEKAAAELRAKRSAAAKKAAATRRANAGTKPATKTATRRPTTKRRAA